MDAQTNTLEAQGDITAAVLPDLDNTDEWPLEPDRDPSDPNDPENWPDADDPSDPLNEASDRAAAVLRAAADAIDGKSARSMPKEDKWCWWEDDEVLTIREQPLTGCWINPFGAVVIMQSRPDEDEREPFVFIRPDYVPTLIRKLASLVELEVTLAPKSVPAPASAPPAPAAARPKRSAPGLFGDER